MNQLHLYPSTSCIASEALAPHSGGITHIIKVLTLTLHLLGNYALLRRIMDGPE